MEGHTQGSQSAATTRLYEAAVNGDIDSLLNLLQEDPLIIDRCNIRKSGSFMHMQSPLHVAASLGHKDFTEKIIDIDPSMCFEHDQNGRTPIHVASMKGKIHVLEVFLRDKPQAAWERTTSTGETILHLCVKNSQLEALKKSVELVGDGELLNVEDSNGNTALHLAVASKQPEMVEFLLGRPEIEKNAMNKKGMTPVDTHMESRKDPGSDKKIEHSLKNAKALPAKEASHLADTTWLEQQCSSLMVVASLIATMAFQVGINPPGGVWQDQKDKGKDAHNAGESIMSYRDDGGYTLLLLSNTVGLLSSLDASDPSCSY